LLGERHPHPQPPPHPSPGRSNTPTHPTPNHPPETHTMQPPPLQPPNLTSRPRPHTRQHSKRTFRNIHPLNTCVQSHPHPIKYRDGPEVDCDLVMSDGVAVYGAITDNWPTVGGALLGGRLFGVCVGEGACAHSRPNCRLQMPQSAPNTSKHPPNTPKDPYFNETGPNCP
jgi:hypothetical protein